VSAKQLRESVGTWKFIGAFCKSSCSPQWLAQSSLPDKFTVNPDRSTAIAMEKKTGSCESSEGIFPCARHCGETYVFALKYATFYPQQFFQLILFTLLSKKNATVTE
ncbi:MAG: hypothetical protein ACXWV1_06565, partial [Chitinophagaceae bacterium]